MKVLLLLLGTLLFSGLTAAQDPRAAREDRTPRRVPATGYTLALSWTPEYCHGHREGAECGLPVARGFTLHGLWPDGADAKRWPQYCHATTPLSPAEIRAGEAATPSPRLLQHEWDKHGSCMAADAATYFREEQRLFRTVRSPDMAVLARRRDLTVGTFAEAFAAANPGVTAAMVRPHLNSHGWLDEVRICLGMDRRPRRCPVDADAASAGARLRVQMPG